MKNPGVIRSLSELLGSEITRVDTPDTTLLSGRWRKPCYYQDHNGNITYLNLSYSNLDAVPEPVTHLVHLKSLRLAGNKLSRPPDTYSTTLSRWQFWV